MMKQSDMDNAETDASPKPKSRLWFGGLFSGSQVADEESAGISKEKEEAARELNNPEWVAAFNGKQCNLDTLEGYIKRKQKNGLMGVAKVPPPSTATLTSSKQATQPRTHLASPVGAGSIGRLPPLIPRQEDRPSSSYNS
jgi:hypothetical protein